MNAVCETAWSRELGSRQKWFTGGKRWEVRGSRSESFRIKFKLPPNKQIAPKKKKIKASTPSFFSVIKERVRSSVRDFEASLL